MHRLIPNLKTGQFAEILSHGRHGMRLSTLNSTVQSFHSFFATLTALFFI